MPSCVERLFTRHDQLPPHHRESRAPAGNVRKVSCVLIFNGKLSGELTFENLYLSLCLRAVDFQQLISKP